MWAIFVSALVACSVGLANGTPQQGLVSVDLMLATQCPDAEACELWFLPQVIKEVGSIMNLTIGMIAEYNTSTKSGYSCMHGETECEADIMQLCVQKYVAQPAYKWYQYVQCAAKNVKLVPQISKPCLETMNVSASLIDDIFTCAQGAEGKGLMTASVEYTYARCGHWAQDPAPGCRSCSMYLEGKLGCVHDGGRAGYFDCPMGSTAKDWIKSICYTYQYGQYYGQGYGNELPPACFL